MKAALEQQLDSFLGGRPRDRSHASTPPGCDFNIRRQAGLIESFYNTGKPVALVCHSPKVLRHVTYMGAPLVKGKHVTGFSNGEEEDVKLTHVVPFLVEDELMRLGAIFEKMANWQPFSITDGRLITGQNPASSTSAAKALLKQLNAEKAA